MHILVTLILLIHILGRKKEQTTNRVGVLKYFQLEIQLWVCLNVFKLLEVAGRYLNKDISSKAFIS